MCLDVRGYYSRRFHVQSFGHVFQVLIKLPRKYVPTTTKQVVTCSRPVSGKSESQRKVAPIVESRVA